MKVRRLLEKWAIFFNIFGSIFFDSSKQDALKTLINQTTASLKVELRGLQSIMLGGRNPVVYWVSTYGCCSMVPE